MPKFTVLDLMMITLIVAALIAIFVLGNNRQISRTWSFSSMPANHDALQNWLEEEGWLNATIESESTQVTIGASVPLSRAEGPKPNWEALGYSGASLDHSVSRSPWLLFKIIGCGVLLYVLTRVVRSARKSSTV